MMTGLYNPNEEHDACGVGFVANLEGEPKRRVVTTALEAMARLAHRGGHAEGGSGDGAGVLLPIPQAFFRKQWPGIARAGSLKGPLRWALGQLFLPRDAGLRASILELVHKSLAVQGFSVEDARDVPLRPDVLGASARDTMPDMIQILALPRYPGAEDASPEAAEACERRLYVARRCMEKAARVVLLRAGRDPKGFHVPSLSCRSVVYKGMLPGADLAAFYPDLENDQFAAPFAVFHERFSTNTLPAWSLAQPFRNLAHNGEINTIKGNVLRMRSRESVLASPLFGADMSDLLPIVDEYGSDSAMFDNVLELLARGGRSLPHALMMMAPEPFGRAYIMGDNKRAFYEYHAALMEPWDGPTAMVFTDGHSQVGTLLDRNGLRPCRYSVDRDGLVVLASETGVAADTCGDVRPQVRQRGQLQPRRMIIADVARRRMVPDAEIKGQVLRAHPYRRWLRTHCVELGSLHVPEHTADHSGKPNDAPPPTDTARAAMFGVTERDVRRILLPMVRNAQEPVEAMGFDQPLAVLAETPQSLFDYFKQQFAQVTNPPIDPQREELSMSLMGFAGRERNLLQPGPEHCGLLKLHHPFLTRPDMERLRAARNPNVRSATLDATFAVPGRNSPAGSSLESALAALCAEAERALAGGATLLVISDAKAGPDHADRAGRAPMPSLLATAAVHHHLLRQGLRHACGILTESGEAFEVMHMALLVAYGASGVCPYTAMDRVAGMAEGGALPGKDVHDAVDAYVTALKKGFLKTLARLGISTLRSFRGAQTFEALGLSPELIERCFTGTVSRLGGLGFAELEAEVLARHRMACIGNNDRAKERENGGREIHAWSPAAVKALHAAVRGDGTPPDERDAAWARFAECCGARNPITLRDLLTLKEDGQPLALAEVEPATDIVRRFVGAAMSFGSLSAAAHETLAAAFNRLGGRSNSGEGGEDPERNRPRRYPDGTVLDTRSRVRQIASGRFGVTAEYLAFADEIQIKMAQGAKPGEGGQLPAHKVTPEIARVRRTVPGVTLISPPPHHDVYSIEDLAQLIFDLRRIQPSARISVKLVAESGVGTVAVGCVKAGADSVIVSGHDGGTGASPLSAIQHVGLPWEMGLSEAGQALEANGLRRRVILQTDGLLRTGRDLAVAALLGADEFAFGTGLLISMGCVMCRRCHLGVCPVGIATQDPALCRAFTGTPEQVERHLLLLAEDLRRHMARLGFRRVQDMIGRPDRLDVRRDGLSPKAATLDLRPLLAMAPAPVAENGLTRCTMDKETPLESAIMAVALPVLQGLSARCRHEAFVVNTDRAVGTRLSGEVARRLAERGVGELPEHSIRLALSGSAGQSLGAFLAPGITLEVRGDANDYVGKGLSGGVLIVAPETESTGPDAVLPVWFGQSVVGNVALYGATSGRAYIGGMAGERFAVRNSGATAVVEGVGDHGCEYMTGGVVVVIGPCGYNFAAGMSGGVAFVYDGDERFQNRCNTDTVDLESVWLPEDRALLRRLLEQHLHHTGSPRAAALLANWDAALSLFVKIVPLGYEDALRRLHASDRNDPDTIPGSEEVFGEGKS